MRRAGITALICVVLSSCIKNNEPSIVCFGDSLTAGYGVQEDESYPARLAQKAHIKVINAGLTGDTTTTALLRIKKDVLSYNPYIVIVEFGANDYFFGFSAGVVDMGAIQNNFKRIIKQLDNGKRKIYVAKFYNDEMVRDMLGDDKAIFNAFEKMYSLLKEEYNVEIIENIWYGIWNNKECMSADKFHPNSAGYNKMADIYFNAIKSSVLTKAVTKQK